MEEEKRNLRVDILGTLKNGNRSWRKERGVGERKAGLEEEQRCWRKDAGVAGRREALEEGERLLRKERDVGERREASQNFSHTLFITK